MAPPLVEASSGRQVSLGCSEKKIIRFPGIVRKAALAFGALDETVPSSNDLVVGNADGLLAVFRNLDEDPLCILGDIGTITCIEVGDIVGGNKVDKLVPFKSIFSLSNFPSLLSELNFSS